MNATTPIARRSRRGGGSGRTAGGCQPRAAGAGPTPAAPRRRAEVAARRLRPRAPSGPVRSPGAAGIRRPARSGAARSDPSGSWCAEVTTRRPTPQQQGRAAVPAPSPEMERAARGPLLPIRGGVRALLAAVELLHEVAEPRAPVALAAQVLAVVLLAAVAVERLDRERDLPLLKVHVDDLHVDLLALRHDVARVLDALVLHLGDVDEPLDAGLELHEGAEVGDLRDLPLHARADRVTLGERGPRIRLDLLDAEAEPLVLDVDVEHRRLDDVTLLELLAGVLDPLRPRDVGDVHEAVDALLDADEDAEVGDVADLAADDGADRVLVLEQRPGVRLDLLHALRPAHLGDVDEPLDALLELDERAVVGERDDLSLHARADGILLVGAVPRVLLDLLEAQADALGGRVELED